LDPCINPDLWAWNPGHPDHERFKKEFWDSYTAQAVRYAKLAEEEGVEMFSIGTEHDVLFRTRADDSFYDHKEELTNLVFAIREVFSGAVTYDMNDNALYEEHPLLPNTSSGT
jgi:hypothetical protein